MGGAGGIMGLPLQVFSTMFAPWRMLGGPQGAQAGMTQGLAQNPINPFSISSLAKLPGTLGAMGSGAVGGATGSMPTPSGGSASPSGPQTPAMPNIQQPQVGIGRSPNGQPINMPQEELMQVFLASLGK